MSREDKDRLKRMKQRLLAAQGHKCAYCNKHLCLDTATFDHIVPLSRGGKGLQNNRCVACRPCNQRKGNQPAHVWVGMLMQGLVA